MLCVQIRSYLTHFGHPYSVIFNHFGHYSNRAVCIQTLVKIRNRKFVVLEFRILNFLIKDYRDNFEFLRLVLLEIFLISEVKMLISNTFVYQSKKLSIIKQLTFHNYHQSNNSAFRCQNYGITRRKCDFFRGCFRRIKSAYLAYLGQKLQGKKKIENFQFT